jgi:hypothetical protein
MLSYNSSQQPHLQSSQLPAVLSDRIVDALKAFVIERAKQSAQMARFAWGWYGLLNKPLLTKFGLLNYYDAQIRNGMNFVDGLSGITLAASDDFSAHYRRSPFSKKKARETLILIGNNGASVLANLRSVQPRVGGPPLPVWQRVFRDLADDPSALAGALLNLLVVTELDLESSHRGGRDLTAEKTERNKLIKSILAQPALLQLPAFSQIEKAFAQIQQSSTIAIE